MRCRHNRAVLADDVERGPRKTVLYCGARGWGGTRQNGTEEGVAVRSDESAVVTWCCQHMSVKGHHGHSPTVVQDGDSPVALPWLNDIVVAERCLQSYTHM